VVVLGKDSTVAGRFTRVQEDFTCLQCGEEVRGGGYTNHCPRCLWSRHVDVHPGDRGATCHSLMEPVAALSDGDTMIVVQRCTGCGHLWRNKVSPADDREAVLALVGLAVPDPSAPRSAKPRPARRPGPRGADDHSPDT
jgi:hypothetical protein